MTSTFTLTTLDQRPLGRFSADTDRVDLLQLPAVTAARLKLSMRQYQQYARLVIHIAEVRHPHVRFGAVQIELAVNGQVLSMAAIAERAEQAVAPLLSAGWQPIICLGEAGGFRMEAATTVILRAEEPGERVQE
jgi:hypothetical protein